MSELKILSSRIAYKGGHIQVREDRLIEPGGHETSREIVVHPGAVCVVARPTAEEVILIRPAARYDGRVNRSSTTLALTIASLPSRAPAGTFSQMTLPLRHLSAD